MEFFTAILVLTSSILVSAKYAPGTKCRSNTECNQNCFEGTWVNVPDDTNPGRDVFACDPEAVDPVEYYTGYCSGGLLDDSTSYRATACGKIGGTNCRNRCVLVGTWSTRDDTERTWEVECLDAGGSTAYTAQRGSEAEAGNAAGCS